MTAHKSTAWQYISIMLLFSIAPLWLLVASLAVQAADLPVTQEKATLTTPLPLTLPSTLTPSLALPCGSGEKHLPDVICLHGVVMLDDNNTPISGVQVTISYQDHTVTGTTFIHPGETEPTYGINISPLQPEFLQPVTVTATYGDLCTRRTVIAFPDFRTQTQELDLRLRDCSIGSLRSVLWGQVIDYATRQPVTGAIVIAEFPGGPETVTTSPHGTGEPGDTTPGYRFDISTNTLVTLTVEYQGDRDQKVFQLSNTIQNVDFVIGWRCEDLSAVPRGGGSGFGLPDLACFWGYGLLNGIPTAGMEVRLVVSNTFYSGQTRLFPGEERPRFGIIVPTSQVVAGSNVIATLSYHGASSTQIFSANLDSAQSQQVHLDLINVQTLSIGNRANSAYALGFQEWQGRQYAWVGAIDGGVKRWDLSVAPITYTTFPIDSVNKLVVDGRARVFANHPTSSGGILRYDAITNGWHQYPVAAGLNESSITLDACDNLWISSNSGSTVYRLAGVSTTMQPTKTVFDTSTAGLDTIDYVYAEPDCDIWMVGIDRAVYLEYDAAKDTYASNLCPVLFPDVSSPQFGYSATGYQNDPNAANQIWFAFNTGVGRLTLTQSPCAGSEAGVWDIYTATHGLPAYNIEGVFTDSSDRIWAASAAGASYFMPETGLWHTLTIADGLPSNRVNVVASDPWSGDVWIGTQDGIARLERVSLQHIRTYTIDLPPFGNSIISAMVPDVLGGIVVGSQGNGAGYYNPTFGTWQFLTTTGSDPLNSHIRCITYNKQTGDLWFCADDNVNHWNPSTSQPYTQIFTTTSVADIAIVSDTVWVFGLSQGITVTVDVLDSSSHQLLTTYILPNPLPIANPLPDRTGILRYLTDRVEVVGEDVWYTPKLGLYAYNPTAGSTKTLTVNTPGSQMLSHNVMARADRNGILWLGYSPELDGHVLRPGGIGQPYDTSTSQWLSLPNLPVSDTQLAVLDITFDNNGDPWFLLNSGLWRYNYHTTKTWEQFVIEGLSAGNLAIAADQTKWLGAYGNITQWIPPAPQSDLSLHLDTAPLIVAGTTNVYTLTITNRGDTDATNTHLTFTLPPTLTYVSATSPPSSDQPLTWDLLTVTASSTVTLVVNADVSINAREGSRLVVNASVTTTSPDAFPYNNSTQTMARVRNGVDIVASLLAPPILIGGQIATYTGMIENTGGLIATDVRATIESPVASSSCTPGDMLPQSQFFCTLTLAVPEDAETLQVDVRANSNPPDSYALNNHASLTLPVYQQTDTTPAIPEKLTLILVAPERLEGSSLLMPQLYKLAEDPSVDGLVLNVLDSVTVTQAYADWQNMRYSPQAANTIAAAIKAYVTPYITAKTKFLVIVGGDQSIPFYRIPDRSRERLSAWGQDSFSSYLLQNSHLAETFRQNMFLTDDFYAVPEATTVYSTQCRDCTLFVPRLASGRLVESAEEISATLDAFLNRKLGFIPTEAVVLANRALTFDLGEKQCDLMGMKLDCVLDGEEENPLGLGRAIKLLYAAVHSNPQSQGALWLREDDTFYEQFQRVFAHTLLITIGCHAGLNLPNALDLVQMFLARGGAVIGSTAYAYASPANIAYSEALAEELTNQLTLATTATLGEALVHAKQRYVVERNGSLGHLGWFDPLDEKVLQPLTLYGLPMIPLDPRPISTFAEQTSVAHPMIAHSSSAPHASSAYTFTFSYDLVGSIEAGMYYTWSSGTKNGSPLSDPGQLLAQSGRPVQPALIFPLTVTAETGLPTGVILRTVQYRDDIDTFKPYFPRVCAISEPCATGPALTPPPANDWDHQLPYVLGVITGTEILQSQASLNLVLGAYHGLNNVERRFEQLVLEVTYNKNGSFDQKAPQITHLAGYNQGEITTLRAQVDHRDRVAQVVGICDDGRGAYTSITLHLFGNGTWTGDCEGQVERFFVQVVDTNGRVITKTTGNNNPWVVPLPDPAPSLDLYLPIISNGLDSIGSNDQNSVESLNSLYLPIVSN